MSGSQKKNKDKNKAATHLQKQNQRRKIHINNSPKAFEDAYLQRLGQTPVEWIKTKIETGSNLNTIKYLFEINAAAIAQKRHCRAQTFERYYAQYKKMIVAEKRFFPAQLYETDTPEKGECPENAGGIWTIEDDNKLFQLYDYGCNIDVIAAYLKRPQNSIIERLVASGKAKSKEEFVVHINDNP